MSVNSGSASKRRDQDVVKLEDVDSLHPNEPTITLLSSHNVYGIGWVHQMRILKSYGLCRIAALTHDHSMMSKYRVEMKEDDGRVGFLVEFSGPKATAYEDGTWQIRVELPQDYPYRSPSIGFQNRIFHPNVDEHSGSVCLDVINQAWSPMFNLVNVFDQFLPQLLTYPNPSDPLNGEAAALMLRDPKAFEKRVKDYVQRYAPSSRSSPMLTPTSTPSDSSEKSKLSKQSSSSASRDEDDMSILSDHEDQPADDLLADMEL